MNKTIINLPDKVFYYTAEVQTLDTFFKKFDPPCKACLVSTMCIQENEYTRNGYKVLLIRKPCELFEKFIEDSPYNRVVLRCKPNDSKQPYGYDQRLWGYR